MGYIRAASVGPVKTWCVRNALIIAMTREFAQTCRSINRALLHGLLSREGKARLGGRVIKHTCTHVFAKRRSVLESVAGAAAGEPQIVEAWMPVNEKVAIPRVLVLAHAAFNHRSIRQGRHMLPQISTQTIDGRRRYNPHAAVGIKGWAVQIKSNLEAAALDIGQCVRQVRMHAVQPDRHSR